MTDFKLVPLKDIKPDPNQPRKFYDDSAMQELTDSVREKGILQPILIRPNGKGYILVCGERRYKAAVSVQAAFKERDSIPAVIRELSDEEALELQIIENLQRKDVHPMEEAVAFQSLLEKGKELKDVAARVGKSEYYVRQRVKLCSLSKEWQKVFYAGRISITDALKVAMFSPDIQKEIYEEDAEGQREIEVSDWTIKKYSSNLADAPFDLTDASLDKKAGACINCKFNSATAALFPEHEQRPKCSNYKCYKNKCDQHFAKAFETALADPEVILVHQNYSQIETDKFITRAKNAGQEILGTMAYNSQIPEPVEEYEDWLDNYADDQDSEDELKREYEKACKEWEQDRKAFEEKVAAGKYKKAFVVHGQDRGKYIYITLTGKKAADSGSSKKTKEKEVEWKLTASDIDAEISRLQEREKRTKEIDENNIWNNLKTHFRPATNIELLKGTLSQVERDAIALTIYNKVGYGGQDEFRRIFKSKKTGLRSIEISGVDEATLLKMMRFFMLQELPPAILYSGYNTDAKMCLQVAGVYFPSVLQKIVNDQAEKTIKRVERVNKRIAELRVKKKELATKKSPAKKK